MPRALTLSMPILVVAILSVGCGSDSSEEVRVESPEVATDGDAGSADPTAFCTAVEALAETDGTTDPQLVLPLIDEMRATAPPEIRDDVHLRLDLLVDGNYAEHTPTSVAPSSLESSAAEQHGAAKRVATFVDAHCDVGTD